MPDDVFLRPEVKVELLACGWYAWPHLVAPIQQAMNLAFRQVPQLESFIANPAIHAAAAVNPAFVGGPFVALTEADTNRAKALLEEMKRSCSERIAFARDFRELDRRIQEGAHGFCLDEFYGALPGTLAGLVELVYDPNQHPRARVREELAYDSGWDTIEIQQVYLHDTPGERRAFFMSTPRLPRPGELIVTMPYVDPRLDALCAMRLQPGSLREVEGQFDLDDRARADFCRLFTPEPPARRTPHYAGDGVRVRYFGHACVLVQTSEVAVLIDPTVAWERDDEEATLTFVDLPDRVDYVVLSHAHQDHFCPEVLVQLRQRIGRVIAPRHSPGHLADPSIELMLRRLGFSNVQTVDPLDEIAIPGGTIVSLPFPGEHCDLDVSSKQSVLVSVKGRRLLFLIDSDAVDRALYRRLLSRVNLGRVDALFIGMECHGAPLSWLYGPLLTQPPSRRDDESRRLNGSDGERAWSVVEEIGCARAFVYAMGQERWLGYLMGLRYPPGAIQIAESDRFIEKCRAAGIHAERLLGCREWVL